MEENNKPTYEQLEQLSNQLYQQNEALKRQMAQDSSVLDKIKVLLEVIDRKESLSKKTVSLAEWHLQNILVKPKENE